MSRIAWLCGLGIAVASAGAWADPPTTRPAASEPAAVSTVAPLAPSGTVYVAPFQPLSDPAGWAWAGRAVQQNLSVDLTRARLHPTTGEVDADPLAAARSAGVRYLVTGTYQWVEPQLRFNGQVTEVSTGTVVGVLSATGDGRDLFGLEDELSTQLIRTLAHASHTTRAPADRPVPADLKPDALAAAIAPPAGGTGSAYAGSALQSYVDANRSPSVDYDQQVADVRQRNTFASYNNYGGPDGLGYVDPVGYGGLGYGGLGYGGYGYGYAGYGGGGYLLGVSYPIAGGFGGHVGGGYGGHGGLVGRAHAGGGVRGGYR